MTNSKDLKLYNGPDEPMATQTAASRTRRDHQEDNRPIGNHEKSSEFKPPEDLSGIPQLVHTLKIRKIQPSNLNVEVLIFRKCKRLISWFNASLLTIVSKIAVFSYRLLRLIYRKMFVLVWYPKQLAHWKHIVKLADYAKAEDLPRFQILDKAKVITPDPRVLPKADQVFLVSPHRHYIHPPVYVAELNATTVYGATNIIFSKDKAVCHDLYDFKCDYTSEELHCLHEIDAGTLRLRRLVHDTKPVRIECAAVFVDACATNYAHWITEVLPRIATFCSNDRFAGIPIIIDDGLSANSIQSLAVFAGAEREIIVLPRNRAICVEKLYVTSVAGYVPFERRHPESKSCSHGMFCEPAISLMLERLLALIDQGTCPQLPARIYLRRKSGIRNVTNLRELETVLTSSNYYTVSPEELTFMQQFALFHNATHVIGPTGAAFANIIFCKTSASIQIFISRFKGTSYWYWQNLACSSRNSVQYLLGRINGLICGIHSDYSIDKRDLIDALEDKQ